MDARLTVDPQYPFQARFLRMVASGAPQYAICEQECAELVEVQMLRGGHYGRLAFSLPQELGKFERLMHMLRISFEAGKAAAAGRSD